MGLSLMQRVAQLPPEARAEWLHELSDQALIEVARGEWWYVARPEQIPPPGDWLIALALAGRGWGKSRAGAEWLIEQVVKHPYDRHGQPTEWLLIGETLADTRTICLEGPAGILTALRRRKIDHRYKQSPRPMVLFPEGAKVYAEGADDEDVGRGYNASGAWLDEVCVAEDQVVQTSRGQIPIQNVVAGDRVLTREGYRAVLCAGLTSQSAQVIRLVTSSGSVELTGNHKVWTLGRNWVLAQDVRPGDRMLSCQIQSQAKPQLSMTGMGSDGSSTNVPDIISTVRVHCFTGACGSRSMDLFPMATRSITSIESDGITDWATSNYSRSLPTEALPRAAELIQHGYRVAQNEQVPVCVNTGRTGSRSLSYAWSAERPISVLECEPSSVQRNAGTPSPGDIRPTLVLAVEKVSVPTRVYDLEVEGASEFFAGGLLVHNCKWPKPYESWYEGILPSLRVDLIGDHPRAFVTTTPKPIKILREWLGRTDGTVHLMGGSTFDNAVNLSQHVLRELKNRYAGTTLGEQELYGKMLELAGGGLFKRLDIVRNRVQEAPDELISIVVGVDPNLTGEDAETGIVVVARDAKDEMYVLADASYPGTGRAAAVHMWRVVAQYGADILVYETNLGKRWMQEVLSDAYVELRDEENLFPRNTTPPMKGVDSKHGKKTRAEPVAMRNEQGRLHIVGAFETLEDQMILFDPESTRESPDRMDALVHACRYLMAGEKRRMRVADPSKYDFRLGQELYDLGRLLS